jgi:hypothetical protein
MFLAIVMSTVIWCVLAFISGPFVATFLTGVALCGIYGSDSHS